MNGSDRNIFLGAVAYKFIVGCAWCVGVHYNAFDSFNYNEEEIEIYKHFKAISNNIVLSYNDPSADLKYFESVSL